MRNKSIAGRGLVCIAFLAALALVPVVAVGGSLDLFKGMEGSLDIAGGTAHIPVMKEAAKKIIPTTRLIEIVFEIFPNVCHTTQHHPNV